MKQPENYSRVWAIFKRKSEAKEITEGSTRPKINAFLGIKTEDSLSWLKNAVKSTTNRRKLVIILHPQKLVSAFAWQVRTALVELQRFNT